MSLDRHLELNCVECLKALTFSYTSRDNILEVRSTQFHFLFYLEKNTEWDANSAVLSSKKKHMRHRIKLFPFKNSRDEFLFCCFMNVRCKNHTNNDAMCALYFHNYNFKLKVVKTFKKFLANLNFTLHCNLHDSVRHSLHIDLTVEALLTQLSSSALLVSLKSFYASIDIFF